MFHSFRSLGVLPIKVLQTGSALGLLIIGLSAAPAWGTQGNTITLWPGPDLQERLQAALINLQPGDTLQLGAGIFNLTDGLSLDVDNVTIKGMGRKETRLVFAEQETAGEGLLVTSDHVTLTDFAVLDTRSDGIKAKGCKNLKIQGVHVEWTRGPHTENGAYGIYPVECTGVLIEGSFVIGASDAGIYVGQSSNIIVRNNAAQYNVAGLEIENSFYADVIGNELSHNTAGILVFDLPNLPQQGGHHVRVFNNRSHHNDTPNFAVPGTVVADVPLGVGILVMANSSVEIFANYINDNATANLMVVSYQNEYEDSQYNPIPKDIYIHNNTFGNGGFDPDMDKVGIIADIAGTPVPDIVWDGVTSVSGRLFGTEPTIILGENNNLHTGQPAGFVNLDLIPYVTPIWSWTHSPDKNPDNYSGRRESLPPVELDF
ncbi:MAG: parallel beta-helix domain-containing protein [Gammaproteobacteria bacterium]